MQCKLSFATLQLCPVFANLIVCNCRRLIMYGVVYRVTMLLCTVIVFPVFIYLWRFLNMSDMSDNDYYYISADHWWSPLVLIYFVHDAYL